MSKITGPYTSESHKLWKHRFAFLIVLALLVGVSQSFAATHHSKHKTTHHRGRARVKKAGAWKRHGQHEIGDERARDIQEALIAHKYMSGTASGAWDAETKAAMAKYQGDQGWQTKRVPDARALIKLGLGPNHVANPATQMTGIPAVTAVAPQR